MTDGLIPETQYTRVRNSIYLKAAQLPRADADNPLVYHYDEHGKLTHTTKREDA